MDNLEQIVAQYYTDHDGNPMSYHIIRKFQISPNNFQVQLDGVFDKHKGVEVVEPDGMFRVKNHDELSKNKYYVRADGNVFFDESMAGKTVKIDYYSIGLPCIGAGRIYTLLDDKGNVIETLQDIIQAGQTAIKYLETFADVKIVVDEIKTSQYQALKCRKNLDEGIDEARDLFDKLNATDFVQKNQFTQMLGNFNEKVKEIYNSIDKNKGLTDKTFTEVKKTVHDNKELTDRAFTEVKKEASTLKDNISKTSIKNFVANPIFNSGDYKGWELWGDITTCLVQPETTLGHNFALKLQCKKRSQGIKQTIKNLQCGKTYTFKAKLKVEEGLPGIMVRNNEHWNGISFKAEQGYNKWVELKISFVAREGTTPIYIGNISNDSTSTFLINEVMIYEGMLDIPFIDNFKEIYTKKFKLNEEGVVWGDGEGTYSNTNDKGELEYVTNGVCSKYIALTYTGGVTIPEGNPGTVYFKLPKEFTKRKNSLKWNVVPSGYYYNTTGNFFPFYISVGKSGEAFEKDGFMVLPIEGICKIQNGNNSSDSQNISVNANILVFA